MSTPKIVFDPAFFENFEGSQEELEQAMEEIMQLFEGKTAEEIKTMGQPVDWDEMSDEDTEHLERALYNAQNDIKPTLQ